MLIGRLLYLTTTRSDIDFLVQQLNQYISKPRIIHFKVVMRVLQYFKSAFVIGLFFSATTNFLLSRFADSNWETYYVSHRSVTDYAVFLGSSVII